MNSFNPVTRIKVFGIGGAGCNAVNRMVEANLVGVDFYVVNTDRQVLSSSPVDNKILIGSNTTGGLGAGGKPEVGKAAALESIDEIKEAVQEADLIFITAGLGGGTGTGAGPILAECAQETGALTVGIVTKPFRFEGKKRTMQAINGLDELRKHVDSLIIIPNEKVGLNLGSYPINQAFLEADNVLRQAVQTITDLISYNALINLDFADVKSVLSGQGTALIGVGEVDASEVENKEEMARLAAERAVNCPLLEANIQGAKNAIINVSGATSLTIDNAEAAVGYINEVAGNEIDTVFGVAYNEALDDRIIVTVIATGFDQVDSPVYEKPGYDSIQEEIESKDDLDIPSFVTNRRR
ncbi:MAG: cell division protein FtsZ [Bacillota bacterium]|jgi:cell division protein FtsZ|nr:cell division protein FtsZ [Bacillota bacterium]NLL27101.1 cell division protein FtsZ [Erysipelotrichia bacterium]